MKYLKTGLLLFIILLIAGFLRFYQLSEIPSGLNQDESALGYNAYSILTIGKDEHGQSWPLYFKSFGDYKLPAYVYLTAASEHFFGLNEFAVRFPSALLGTFAILLLFLLVKEFTRDTRLALVSAAFLAINPWHLFFSRAAFEDNIALTFAMLGIWLFLKALRSKPLLYLPLSMVGFILSLYSYNVTRLLAPLLLIALIIYTWKQLRTVSWIAKVLAFLVFTILLVPFFVTFFTPSGAVSAEGALITSTDIQAKSIEMRSYFTNEYAIFGKIFFNKYTFSIWQYLENIGSLFSVSFFFLKGSNHGTQGIGNMGMFYLFQLPLLFIGMILILKKKIKGVGFFVIWAIISALVVSLSKDVPHATRGYFLVIPLTVFAAVGGIALIQWMLKIKNKFLKIACFALFSIFCLYNLVYYFSSYFLRFPLTYAKEWKQQDKALTQYLIENEGKYTHIYIDDSAGFVYTSFLFYAGIDPQKLQDTGKRYPDDVEGYSTLRSIGKYQWKKVNWDKEFYNDRTLIVTSLTTKPFNKKPAAVFKYDARPLVLSVKEQIVFYPTSDVAYVLMEGKSRPVKKPVILTY